VGVGVGGCVYWSLVWVNSDTNRSRRGDSTRARVRVRVRGDDTHMFVRYRRQRTASTASAVSTVSTAEDDGGDDLDDLDDDDDDDDDDVHGRRSMGGTRDARAGEREKGDDDDVNGNVNVHDGTTGADDDDADGAREHIADARGGAGDEWR